MCEQMNNLCRTGPAISHKKITLHRHLSTERASVRALAEPRFGRFGHPPIATKGESNARIPLCFLH